MDSLFMRVCGQTIRSSVFVSTATLKHVISAKNPTAPRAIHHQICQRLFAAPHGYGRHERIMAGPSISGRRSLARQHGRGGRKLDAAGGFLEARVGQSFCWSSAVQPRGSNRLTMAGDRPG